ncbi:MAG: hypothetical protein EOM23_09330 [Candidatus Moranbacteria bacterium]|nr:hypothetical protein [Candidatus Moranbacteria bacterium]
MNLIEFKQKLDNREFWGENSTEMWDAAYSWLREVNSDDNLCKWSWDCGLKLDYDGDICRISSRFYPPHKSSAEYGKYSGSISVYIGDDEIYKHEVEASSLDDLKAISEGYVTKIIERITANIKAVFS